MKATLFLIAYAALISAAPQGAVDPLLTLERRTSPPVEIEYLAIRCGGEEGTKCPKGQTCGGSIKIGDGKGVCIPKPNWCANALGDKCPSKNDICVNNDDEQCEEGEEDCGGGVCMPANLAKKVGLIIPDLSKAPSTCAGPNNKKCPSMYLCIGEGSLLNGGGICMPEPNLIECGRNSGGCPNPKVFVCVNSDLRWKCPSDKPDCGTCVPKIWAIKSGGGLGKPKIKVRPRRCSLSSECDNKDDQCLGEREIMNQGGVCVPKPKSCNGFRMGPCAEGDYCVENPDQKCPLGVADCGGGKCLPAEILERVGVKEVNVGGPFWCGGSTGMVCRDNLYEVCVGEKEGINASGVCVPRPRACGGTTGKKCYDGEFCLSDPRVKCKAKQKCAGLCVSAKAGEMLDLKQDTKPSYS
ncbi:hypothetical protein ABW20_dc0108982 [Dactylellina cionopaga]|nr:hypothetical protein ABW20_dc0108982 [Dactylellina cionopaga]